MTSVEPDALTNEAEQTTEVLRSAIRLDRQGYLHPGRLKKRLSAIAEVWVIGLISLIVAVTLMTHGTAATEEGRLTLAFASVLSTAVLIAATVGFLVSLWSAYVGQFALALQYKAEAFEYQLDSVAQAALQLASNAEFRQDLAKELVKVNRSPETAETIASAAVIRLAEKAKAAAANEN